MSESRHHRKRDKKDNGPRKTESHDRDDPFALTPSHSSRKHKKRKAVSEPREEKEADDVSETVTATVGAGECMVPPACAVADQVSLAPQCCVCLMSVRPPAVSCSRGNCVMCSYCATRMEEVFTANRSAEVTDMRCPKCREPLHPLLPMPWVDRAFGDVPTACQYDCGTTDLTLATVGAHERTCANKPVNCGFSEFGCSWVGRADAKVEHEALCTFRVMSDCNERAAQLGATFDRKLQTLSAKIANATSLLRIFNNYTAKGCKTTVEIRMAKVPGCAAMEGSVATPLADFAIYLEQLASPAPELSGGVGCAIRLTRVNGGVKKVAVSARVTFFQGDLICAIGSVGHAFPAEGRVLRAREVSYVGQFDLNGEPPIARLAFDVLSEWRSKQ